MLSDEQRMMKETADDFVLREVVPRVRRHRGQEARPDARAAAEGGRGRACWATTCPRSTAASGGDKTSSGLITEAASRNGSFAVSFGAHVGIGTMPIVLFGTAEQRKKYLPKLASGEMIAAYALTEPGSGSDALAAKTKAVKSADGKSWKLTGFEAVHHQRGLRRSVHGVREGGRRAVHRLPDRAQRAGFTVGPEEHKLGIRGSSTCPLFLEDCTIPIDSVLGTIGQGHKIAFNILNIGRWKLGVGSVAGAKYCLELA
jgi:alkylation response protein AidB-like acyl-CoA dehydrogenase